MNRPAGIEAEYEGLSLGDARLQRRALAIVERVISGPAQSFPQLLPTSAELEGAYRFFQNDAVSASDLLNPHLQASLARARQDRTVRIVHDTTAMSFGGSRDGCGTLGGGGSGFWAQMALAVSAGEERVPLGVVGLETMVYPTLEEKKKDFQNRLRRFRREKLRTFPSASIVWPGLEKWSTIPLRLRDALKGVRVIHVMDREADNFELMSLLKKQKMHFVVRGSSARSVGCAGQEEVRVENALAKAEIVLRRRVRLTARPKQIGDHPQTAGTRRDPQLARCSGNLEVDGWWQALTERRRGFRTQASIRRRTDQLGALHHRTDRYGRADWGGRRSLSSPLAHRGVLQGFEDGLQHRKATADDL